MTQDLFSVTIFFVVFRETLEAAVIVSVLLSLVEQIVQEQPDLAPTEQTLTISTPPNNSDAAIQQSATHEHSTARDMEKLILGPHIIRKLRLQVLLGASVGLVIAVTLGAAFIAIWFTEATNLWSKSEQLWEAIFELIASLMIFVMGVTMLKMDRARIKWRVKLQNSFTGHADRRTMTGKWVLFILPMITVLREGIEAIIFVGGVALGEPAKSIPIAAITGVICGLICGFGIYQFASRTTLKIFLVCMTNLILLIGAGLFSKAAWSFQENAFIQLLGVDVDDTGGTGPGSYDVRGNVWHLDCCSSSTGSWSLFNAVFGWQNSATLGSVLSYVFYWLAVIVVLVYLKFKEGRTKLLGLESANGKSRRQLRERGEVSVAPSTENELEAGPSS
ncbi:iron permease FTR1 [Paxillus ammoniavirescens]|nr:iron permease FTR1 [Paxillus ammoniavirescens]